jgi:tetratricopeptide (TPR) repeat protein
VYYDPYLGAYTVYPYPYLPPLVLPADSMFGLSGAERFLGSDPTGSTAGSGPVHRPRDEEPASRRSTNREALARAEKFIGYGDNHFGNQHFSDANQRYRSAVEAAPGLATGHFRQGFALVAMGRYPPAAKEFRRGLELDPAWPRSGFRLAELYRNNQMAKSAHFDALAKAATQSAHDPDLLFLLGVMLYFDGRVERAKPFFQRAEQLAAGACIHPFLKEYDRLQKKQAEDEEEDDE